MLHELFNTLRSIEPPPGADVLHLAAESVRAFDLIIDFLRSPDAFFHPAINALTTLCWHLIGNKEIPMILDPSGGTLPSLHFLVGFHPRSLQLVVLYILPYGYLDLVRTDQIMQCCALVNMASQGCDYYAHRLDATRTPQRAQAYEAELLLALQPVAQASHLPWNLNTYLQGVLRAYPAGLASLPPDQLYTPPTYPMH